MHNPSPRPAYGPDDVSVVIPALNAADKLLRCLEALRATHSATALDITVVDDGSTDRTAEVARTMGCRTLTNPSSQGPASARNRGARAAQGRLLLFIDADVRIEPGWVAPLLQHFNEGHDMAAVQGVYTEESHDANLPTTLRDLFKAHRFSRIEDQRLAALNTFCCCISRRVFEQVGGFDDHLQAAASEDTDLGVRLFEAGHRIALERRLQVQHLKRYSALGLLRSDYAKVFHKMKLSWRRRGLRNMTVSMNPVERMLPELLALGLAPYVALSLLCPPLWPVGGPGLALFAALNADFLRFISRRKGWRFAAASLPLFLADLAGCHVAILHATLEARLLGRSY